MAVFLTLNTYLLDIRLFGRIPLYKAAPHIDQRLTALPGALLGTGADVICLQEVFRKPHRRFLADALAPSHPFAAGVRHAGLPLGTGLMVLSRHPIRDARFREFRSAVLEERIAVRMGMLICEIDLPDLGPTRVVDFHLSAGGLKHHPESPAAEALRECQIQELVHAAWEPALGPVVMAGDLNSGPHTSTVNHRRVLDAGFRDAFAEAGAADRVITWDPANPVISGERNHALPPQRIDHVFLRTEGSENLRVTETRVVLNNPVARISGGETIPVSDHYGLLAEIGKRTVAE